MPRQLDPHAAGSGWPPVPAAGRCAPARTAPAAWVDPSITAAGILLRSGTSPVRHVFRLHFLVPSWVADM
ncbi:hypothetical protein FRAAL3173 [Frankia alni ACN14a]|uniref:Uncharacterized protein n=1 Tax=Frankia alni (strain DSM 45986 / CECT 9034 / ACN14a) TaxID=326424 RepID=Q0RKY8_FRAAA|nr:hypothetical protein FRAAL3173 [Frankia alni ACN14a]